MEHKHYHTAGRDLLVAYLSRTAAEPPQSADAVFRGLSEEKGRVPGYSTVYRLLAELCEEGVVRKFRAAGEGFTYQYIGTAHDCERHFHLQCLSCGRVEHLECACSSELSEHLHAAHGFEVDRGKSVLYGLCAACAAKKEGETV